MKSGDLVVWDSRSSPKVANLCYLDPDSGERAMRQFVETEKGKSCRNKIAETGSLINQEEKQQKGMV